MTGYFSGYLGECVGGYLGGFLNVFVQDPVMPSQEPPSDAKREEVDLPPDDTEDTDGSKTLKPFPSVFLTRGVESYHVTGSSFCNVSDV